jgi:hypothetical protein
MPAMNQIRLVLAILLAIVFCSAKAEECDEAEIRSKLSTGDTVAEVAEACDVSPEVVRFVMKQRKPVPAPTPSPPNGLPPGTPVGQCGCWGPADPNFLQPHSQCQSGFASPQMCNMQCPAGGFMWRGVCT